MVNNNIAWWWKKEKKEWVSPGTSCVCAFVCPAINFKSDLPDEVTGLEGTPCFVTYTSTYPHTGYGIIDTHTHTHAHTTHTNTHTVALCSQDVLRGSWVRLAPTTTHMTLLCYYCNDENSEPENCLSPLTDLLRLKLAPVPLCFHDDDVREVLWCIPSFLGVCYCMRATSFELVAAVKARLWATM